MTHSAQRLLPPPAQASITLPRTDAADSFEARVTPANDMSGWGAYWTVTASG